MMEEVSNRGCPAPGPVPNRALRSSTNAVFWKGTAVRIESYITSSVPYENLILDFLKIYILFIYSWIEGKGEKRE